MLRALAHGRVSDDFGVGAMYSTILVILQVSVGLDRVVMYLRWRGMYPVDALVSCRRKAFGISLKTDSLPFLTS